MTWDNFIGACGSLPGSYRATQPDIDGLRVRSKYFAYPLHVSDDGVSRDCVVLKAKTNCTVTEALHNRGHAQAAIWPHESWSEIDLDQLDPVTAYELAFDSHAAALKQLSRSEREAISMMEAH